MFGSLHLHINGPIIPGTFATRKKHVKGVLLFGLALKRAFFNWYQHVSVAFVRLSAVAVWEKGTFQYNYILTCVPLRCGCVGRWACTGSAG